VGSGVCVLQTDAAMMESAADGCSVFEQTVNGIVAKERVISGSLFGA